MIGTFDKDDRRRLEWFLLRNTPNGYDPPLGCAPAPPGCKFYERWMHGEISPEVTGFLPNEAKWKEKMTHSKSYDPVNKNDLAPLDN